jgi:hypothetical protein
MSRGETTEEKIRLERLDREARQAAEAKEAKLELARRKTQFNFLRRSQGSRAQTPKSMEVEESAEHGMWFGRRDPEAPLFTGSSHKSKCHASRETLDTAFRKSSCFFFLIKSPSLI